MEWLNQIIFLNPHAAWLLILVPSSLLLLQSKLKGPRKYVLRGLGFIRGFILTLIVLSLCNPTLMKQTEIGGPHFFIGYDGSASLHPEILENWLKDWQTKMNAWHSQNAGKLSFFRLAENVELYRDFDQLIESLEKPRTNFSRLADGLYELERSIENPEYPVYILLSDLNETENSERLQDFIHKPFYLGVIPLRQSPRIRIENINSPNKVLRGRKFQIKYLLSSDSAQRIKVELLHNKVVIEKRDLSISAGYYFLDFDLESKELGSSNYELKMTIDQNGVPKVITRQSQVQVYQTNTCLIIAEKSAEILEKLLKDIGLEYEYLKPAEINLDYKFDDYSFVIINDVKSEKLDLKIQQNLNRYVFDGGGLGMLGGFNSFGLGGYFDTPIEKALPVYMPPRSYRKSMAVVFIIDSSGSMLGAITQPQILVNGLLTKSLQLIPELPESERPISLSKESVKRVIQSMRGVDVGVVSFNTLAYLAVPVQTVTEDNTKLFMEGVDSISAGGGTRFYPALRGALTILADQRYEKIEFIFLSDGAPSDWKSTQHVLKELKEKKIRLSTIAFGVNAHREKLQIMAATTGGEFFNSDDMPNLSKVFDEAVEKVFGPPVVLQETKVKWVPDQNFIKPEPAILPAVLGYVATSPKDRGQVVIASERGDPIFSIWNYGAGHSFAWTPDFSSKWSGEWLENEVFSRLFAETLQKISKNKSNPYSIKASVSGNRVNLEVFALDDQGDMILDLDIYGQIQSSSNNNFKREVFFSNQADGYYKSELLIKNPADYDLELNLKRANEQRFIQKQIQFSVQDSYELNFKESNTDFIESVRAIDPKRIINRETDLDLIFKAYKTKFKSESVSFSLLFLGLAIFLLCVEILFRRFRVLEELHEESSDQKLKFERMASHSLKLARSALKKGDNSAAENFYLSAHRYLKQAGAQADCQAVWEEYRVKVK